jgi:hypothetical protein
VGHCGAQKLALFQRFESQTAIPIAFALLDAHLLTSLRWESGSVSTKITMPVIASLSPLLRFFTIPTQDARPSFRGNNMKCSG